MSGRPRILIVDDEAPVLATYQMILEQHGYAVTAVRTTAEALKVLETGHFRLILCDLQLESQRSGFEVIAAARRRDPDISAVLLTGYATGDAIEEAGEKGITLVFKPVDIQEFLPLLDSLVRRPGDNVA
jgi:CheY-like chemotaxis protein